METGCALDLVCSVCEEIFVYRQTLIAHILDSHNDPRSLQCFVLKKIDAKSASISFQYYGNKYRCKTCSYKTQYRTLFEEHARCHLHETPYKCFWCSCELAGSSLVEHFAKEHSRLRIRFADVLQSVSMDKILKNLGPKAPLLITPRVHKISQKNCDTPIVLDDEQDIENDERGTEIETVNNKTNVYSAGLFERIKPLSHGKETDLITIDDDDDNASLEKINLYISSAVSLSDEKPHIMNSISSSSGEVETLDEERETEKVTNSVDDAIESMNDIILETVTKPSLNQENIAGAYDRSLLLVKETNTMDNMLISEILPDTEKSSCPAQNISDATAEESLDLPCLNSQDSIVVDVEFPVAKNVEPVVSDEVQNSFDTASIMYKKHHDNIINDKVQAENEDADNNTCAADDMLCTIENSDHRYSVCNSYNISSDVIGANIVTVECVQYRNHCMADSKLAVEAGGKSCNDNANATANQTDAMITQEKFYLHPNSMMNTEESQHPVRSCTDSLNENVTKIVLEASINTGDLPESDVITDEISLGSEALAAIHNLEETFERDDHVEDEVVQDHNCLLPLPLQIDNVQMSSLEPVILQQSVQTVSAAVTTESIDTSISQFVAENIAAVIPIAVCNLDSASVVSCDHIQNSSDFKCSVCSFHFENPLDRARHEVWHMRGLEHVCCPVANCDFIIISFEGFIHHVLEDHKPFAKYSCPQCLKECETLEMFVEHLRSSRSSLWRCQECQFTCKDSIQMGEHIRSFHNTSQCMAVDADELTCRSVKMLEQPVYSAVMQCPFCTYAPQSKEILQVHVAAVHYTEGVRFYHCGYCAYQTTSKCMIDDHLRQTHASEQISYNECKEYVKKDGVYLCPVCLTEWNSLSLLARHANSTHLKAAASLQPFIERFHCDICSFSTNEESDLDLHATRVHGIEPKCLQREVVEEASILGTIKSNVAIVRSVAKKSSSKSAKSFVQNLQASKKSTLLLQCNECSFTTTYPSTLGDHAKTHAKAKIKGWYFDCSICHIHYIELAQLKRHHQNHHAALNFEVNRVDLSPAVKNRECSPSVGEVGSTKNLSGSKSGFKLKIAAMSNKSSIKKTFSTSKCPKCTLVASKINLETHKSTHVAIEKQGWWVECDYCGVMANSPDKLRAHTNRAHVGMAHKYSKHMKGTNVKIDRSDHAGDNDSCLSESSNVLKRSSENAAHKSTSLKKGNTFSKMANTNNKTNTLDSLYKKTNYSCSECCYRTNATEKLRNHQRNVHEAAHKRGWVLICEYCGLASNLVSSFTRHTARHHYGLKVKYRHQTVSADGNHALNVSQAKEKTAEGSHQKRDTNFPCDECSYVAKFNFSLNRHKKRKHSSSVVSADVANLLNQSKEAFQLGLNSQSFNSVLPLMLSNMSDVAAVDNSHMNDTAIDEVNNDDSDSLDDENNSDADDQLLGINAICEKVMGREYKCSQCAFTHRFPSKVRRHFHYRHVKFSEYRCYYCSFESVESGKVKRHCRSLHADKPIRVIKRSLSSALSSVMASDNRDVDVEIMGDGDSTSVNNCLISYIERKADNEQVCRICNYTQVGASSLKRHILAKHLKVQPYSCKYCGADHMEINKVKKHIAVSHPSLPYRVIKKQLDISDIEESLAAQLEATRKKTTKSLVASAVSPAGNVGTIMEHSESFAAVIKTEMGSQNSDQFISKENSVNEFSISRKLKSTVTSEQSQRKLIYCGHCNKSLADERNMKEHILHVHFNQKSYFCSWCDFGSFSWKTLKRHCKKNHSKKEANIKHSPYFDLIKIDANRIMTLKNGSIAENTIGTTSGIKNDMHNGKKGVENVAKQKECIASSDQAPGSPLEPAVHLYVCMHCNQNYEALKFVKNHVFSHLLNQVYVCSECGANCNGKESLKSHFTSIHPGQAIKVVDISEKLNINYKNNVAYVSVKPKYVKHSDKLASPIVPSNTPRTKQSNVKARLLISKTKKNVPPQQLNRVAEKKETVKLKKKNSHSVQIEQTNNSVLTETPISSISSKKTRISSANNNQNNESPSANQSGKKQSTLCNEQQSAASHEKAGNIQPATPVPEGKAFCCRHCGLMANSLLSVVEHMLCHFKDGNFCCTQCDYWDPKCTVLREHYKTCHESVQYTSWLNGLSDILEKKIIGSRTMVFMRDEQDMHNNSFSSLNVPVLSPSYDSSVKASFSPVANVIPALSPQVSLDNPQNGRLNTGSMESNNLNCNATEQKVHKWVCKHCNGNYYRKSSAITHLRCHIKEPMIKCRFCGKRFLTKHELFSHNTNEHKRGPQYNLVPYVDRIEYTKMGRVEFFSIKEESTVLKNYASVDNKKDTQAVTVKRKQSVDDDLKCQNAKRRRLECGEFSKTCNNENNSVNKTVSRKPSKSKASPLKIKKEIDSSVKVKKEIDSSMKIKRETGITEKTKSVLPSFVCVLCKGNYNREEIARRHVRTVHLGKKAFKCELCDEDFEYRRVLEAHHAAIHPQMSLTFTNLAQELFSECMSYLERKHSNESQFAQTFSCYLCKFSTDKMQIMRDHLFKEFDYKPYECNLCGTKASLQKSINQHVTVAHDGNRSITVHSDTKTEQHIEDCLQRRCCANSRSRSKNTFEVKIQSSKIKNLKSSASNVKKRALSGFLRLQKKKPVVRKKEQIQRHLTKVKKQNLIKKLGNLKKQKSNMKLTKIKNKPVQSALHSRKRKSDDMSTDGRSSDEEADVNNDRNDKNDDEYKTVGDERVLTSESWLECTNCPDQFFSSRRALNVHSFYHHRDSDSHQENNCCLIHCPYCAQSFMAEDVFVKHVCNQHVQGIKFYALEDGSEGDTALQCIICTEVCASAAEYNAHVQTHLPVNEFKCSYCSYMAMRKWDVMKHAVNQHPGKQIVSIRCHRCISRCASPNPRQGILTDDFTLQPLVYLKKLV